MATDTILPENTQQFSDDEIVDNFGGPDDGVPMGLGGEKGKQSEPASSTLEADMLQPPKPKQEEKPLPDDAVPSDDAAAGGEPEPVRDTAREDGKVKAVPQTDEPESPEFPETLLQMAGFSTSEDAQKAGFKDPESLLAAVQWRGRSLAAPAKPSRSSYLESEKPQPTTTPVETPPSGDGTFKRFKPANPEVFDEELLKLLDEQDKHYAAQFEQLASRLKDRDEDGLTRQALRQAEQFDQVVQGLIADWEPEFGKGSGDTLFRNTDVESVAAAQNRLDLFDAVNLLRQTNAEHGGKPMTLEQEVQWALMQRYPDKFKQQLLRDREAKVKGRRGVQASRPAARKVPLATKNERLLSALQTKYPKGGFDQGDSDHVGDI